MLTGALDRTRRPSPPGFAICDVQGRSRSSRLAMLHRTGNHAVVPESDGPLTAQVPSLGEEKCPLVGNDQSRRWGGDGLAGLVAAYPTGSTHTEKATFACVTKRAGWI